MAGKFGITLRTSLELLQQFRTAIREPIKPSAQQPPSPSPLPLLRASAASLRSEATKLSLLAINHPFSFTAATKVINSINESVLPSLVTATSITTPALFTKTYSFETRSLTETIFDSLTDLLTKTLSISRKQGVQVSKQEEENVTRSTGQIWSGCDALIDLCDRGVFGILVLKLEGYRDLIQDAITELEEWDPDDSSDEEFWGESVAPSVSNSGLVAKDGSREEILAQKEAALKISRAVAQIYPAIKATRFKRQSPSTLTESHVKRLDSLFTEYLSKIPELVDEMAGLLYEHDIKGSQEQLQATQSCAILAVELMLPPWENGSSVAGDVTDDRFGKWGQTWLRIINTSKTT